MRRRGPAFELDVDGAAALADNLREMRRREVRPASLRHRQSVVGLFAQFVAPKPLLSAAEADIERWVDDQIARGLALRSRASYLAQLRGFYAWAARRGVIERDPTIDIRPPKVPAGRPRPIPEQDLRLALMTAGQPVRAWLVLAAYCGLRAGEIGRLRREDVLDTERPPLLVVDNGKGGHSRVLPISEVVVAELGPHLTGRRGRLWLQSNHRPQAAVTNRVSAHLHGLGLPYSAHSLRHRFGTQVYRRSRDLRMTQDLMGHASARTTQIYANPRELHQTGENLQVA